MRRTVSRFPSGGILELPVEPIAALLRIALKTCGKRGSRAGWPQPLNSTFDPLRCWLGSPLASARRRRSGLLHDSARQPSVEQTIRGGGSSSPRTRSFAALRPCVRRAIRVSSETVPVSRTSIAARDTSTIVAACRPSSASSRTDQEAPTSFEPGFARTDSLTFHAMHRIVASRVAREPSRSPPASRD